MTSMQAGTPGASLHRAKLQQTIFNYHVSDRSWETRLCTQQGKEAHTGVAWRGMGSANQPVFNPQARLEPLTDETKKITLVCNAPMRPSGSQCAYRQQLLCVLSR